MTESRITQSVPNYLRKIHALTPDFSPEMRM